MVGSFNAPAGQNMLGAASGVVEGGTKLFVGSLPIGVNAAELQSIFAAYGELQEQDGVYVLPNKGGHDKSCAFVKYKDQAAANEAVKQLNDKPVTWPSHPHHTDAM